MYWSEILASELAQTIAFIGSVLSIVVIVGMACRFVHRYVKKSALPWEAWVFFVMYIGTAIVVTIYSEPRWLSFFLSLVIIAMLELHGRIYQKIIDRANENTKVAIEKYKELSQQTEEFVEQVQEYRNLTKEALSIHQDKHGKGEHNGRQNETEAVG